VKQCRERDGAEARAVDLQRALNRERAQRLADLHANFRVAGDVMEAVRRAADMEARYFDAEAEVAAVAQDCAALELRDAAHDDVHQRTAAEMDSHEIEIEETRAELLLVRRALRQADDDVSSAQRAAAKLQKEVLSLRTELARCATSARPGALQGATAPWQTKQSRADAHRLPGGPRPLRLGASRPLQLDASRPLSLDHFHSTKALPAPSPR